MKLFTAGQIRQLDRYTIEQEPVLSIDLMERAAGAVCEALIGEYPPTVTSFYIVAGAGNNGGDALAVARKLCEQGYRVTAHLIYKEQENAVADGSLSPDCRMNCDRLAKEFPNVLAVHPEAVIELPLPGETDVVIDGLLGTGLNRPLRGRQAEVVKWLNELPNTRISIDVPSGLMADSYHKTGNPCVKADLTLTFQFPKLAFFFIENEQFVGRWKVLDIGLHTRGIDELETPYEFTDAQALKPLLHKRSRFAHKGNFGHLALIAGSKGMAGASILAAKAALRSGVGLLTLHGPEGNRCIVQTIAPEVMFEADRNVDCISEFYHSSRYDALAIGCGIGTRTSTVEMMQQFLNHLKEPCVFDADALNIVAAHQGMLDQLPEGSVLTPHPREFVRMFGESQNSFYRLQKARDIAQRYKLVLVMKGAYTKVVAPDGKVYFNSTGNPGMATAGSGDVLTGIIGSLLAQGYPSLTAARLGVFLHGLSADLALEQESEESMMAGDILSGLGKAFRILKL